MRKRLLSLFLVLLIVLASGCIGGSNSTSTTSSQSTASSTTSHSAQIESKTTTTSQNPLETLKSSLESVEQFTYRGKTLIHMNVTVLVSNFTQNTSISLQMIERGYIDLSSMEAAINTTTITEPDNTTLTTLRVVKDGKTYIKTVIGPGVSSTNVTDNVSAFIWEYNPLSLAKRYIRESPDKVIKNGKTTELTYTLGWQDVKALSILYLAVTEDTGIEVKGGRLSLIFEGEKLTRVEVEYSVVATTVVNDSLLGQMTIKISAKGISDYEITSINERREVEPPT